MKCILIAAILVARLATADTAELAIKRAVTIDAVKGRYLELPVDAAPGNGPSYELGGNLYSKLIEKLTSGDVATVLLDEGGWSDRQQLHGMQLQEQPDPIFVHDGLISSATIRIKINELTFSSGRKGNRLFSGFRQGHENEWNAGQDGNKANEYGSSFAKEFEDYGGARTGLELSKSFGVEALVAGVWMKTDIYRAGMSLEIEIEDYNGIKNKKNIAVSGTGAFADLALHAALQGGNYWLEFRLAQRAALKKAFDKLIQAALLQIVTGLKNIPMRTRIVYHETAKPAAAGKTEIYIFGGNTHQVLPGHEFYADNNGDRFIVSEVFTRVSRVECTSGNCGASVGTILTAGKTHDVAVKFFGEFFGESFGESFGNKKSSGFVEPVTTARAFSTAIWPYELYRYLSYDQAFTQKNKKPITLEEALRVAEKTAHPIDMPALWEKYGLGKKAVKVAVLDSGIDYNHPALNRNVGPEILGVDTISGDERAFDDHGHGTMIASLIAGLGRKSVGVAPLTTLIPVKVFNPYGITSSAAIYSGFKAAVEQRADIIVCAWTSSIKSKALYDGLKLAQNAGVLVVVSESQDSNLLYPANYKNEFSNIIAVPGISEKLGVATPRGGYMRRSQSSLAAGLFAGVFALSKAICSHLTPQNIKKYIENNTEYNNNIRQINVKAMLDSINRDCKP